MLHRQKSFVKKSELDQSDALSACLVLSLGDTANVNLIWLIWAQLHNGLSALPRAACFITYDRSPPSILSFIVSPLKLPKRDEVLVGNKAPGAS